MPETTSLGPCDCCRPPLVPFGCACTTVPTSAQVLKARILSAPTEPFITGSNNATVGGLYERWDNLTLAGQEFDLTPSGGVHAYGPQCELLNAGSGAAAFRGYAEVAGFATLFNIGISWCTVPTNYSGVGYGLFALWPKLRRRRTCYNIITKGEEDTPPETCEVVAAPLTATICGQADNDPDVTAAFGEATAWQRPDGAGGYLTGGCASNDDNFGYLTMVGCRPFRAYAEVAITLNGIDYSNLRYEAGVCVRDATPRKVTWTWAVEVFEV